MAGLPNQLSKKEEWRKNSNCARTMVLDALNIYFRNFYMLLFKNTFIKKTEKMKKLTRTLFILIQNMGWRGWCLSASSPTRAARHNISLSYKVSAPITSIFLPLLVKNLQQMTHTCINLLVFFEVFLFYGIIWAKYQKGLDNLGYSMKQANSQWTWDKMSLTRFYWSIT